MHTWSNQRDHTYIIFITSGSTVIQISWRLYYCCWLVRLHSGATTECTGGGASTAHLTELFFTKSESEGARIATERSKQRQRRLTNSSWPYLRPLCARTHAAACPGAPAFTTDERAWTSVNLIVYCQEGPCFCVKKCCFYLKSHRF